MHPMMFSPYGMPYPMPPQSEVPACVRAAFGFLTYTTEKTKVVIAGNGTIIESFDGQDLTQGEVEVRDAACKLLVDYFVGSCRPSNSPPENQGMTIPCPACMMLPVSGKQQCRMCNGSTILKME
jgi:hypothetical protein